MPNHHSIDPGPDVIQVVLTPRHFLSLNSPMQSQQPLHTLSNNPHPHYATHITSNEDNRKDLNAQMSNSSSMFTSSVSNQIQIQPHQLRELVRNRLIAEDIQLSAPPYTIPKVRYKAVRQISYYLFM